jgi:hypothetical protein
MPQASGLNLNLQKDAGKKITAKKVMKGLSLERQLSRLQTFYSYSLTSAS